MTGGLIKIVSKFYVFIANKGVGLSKEVLYLMEWAPVSILECYLLTCKVNGLMVMVNGNLLQILRKKQKI